MTTVPEIKHTKAGQELSFGILGTKVSEHLSEEAAIKQLPSGVKRGAVPRSKHRETSTERLPIKGARHTDKYLETLSLMCVAPQKNNVVAVEV